MFYWRLIRHRTWILKWFKKISNICLLFISVNSFPILEIYLLLVSHWLIRSLSKVKKSGSFNRHILMIRNDMTPCCQKYPHMRGYFSWTNWIHTSVSNADLWLCLGIFFFFVPCWFPLPCMPPAHTRSPPLRLLPSLLRLLWPDQTASSDRRGAWEVQPNRQANSYLTSHLASDRHGGSVQVSLHLLHPSISQFHSPVIIILCQTSVVFQLRDQPILHQDSQAGKGVKGYLLFLCILLLSAAR